MVSWIKTKIQKFVAFSDENIDLPPPVAEQGEPVSFVDNFVYLGSAIGIGDDLSQSWELRPPLWIPSTAVFGGVDILLFRVWFSLSCYMAARLGASELVNVAIWILSTWALRRIMGYHWDNLFSNERILHATGLGCMTCMIRKPQLQLFNQGTRLLGSN